jgi:hypothetical protein
VVGDFNNDDDDLPVAFPELFERDTLAEAVQFGPEEFDDRYNARHQLDHILYTSEHLSLVGVEIIRDPADHRGIVAEFKTK